MFPGFLLFLFLFWPVFRSSFICVSIVSLKTNIRAPIENCLVTRHEKRHFVTWTNVLLGISYPGMFLG